MYYSIPINTRLYHKYHSSSVVQWNGVKGVRDSGVIGSAILANSHCHLVHLSLAQLYVQGFPPTTTGRFIDGLWLEGSLLSIVFNVP